MQLRDHVENMKLYELIQVVKEYEEYEQTGKTGDTMLREIAETIGPDSSILMFIEIVIKEVYRVLAYRYISVLE